MTSVKAPRPKMLESISGKYVTGCGNLYVTVSFTGDGKPFEVFGILGKAGGCTKCIVEAVTRSITLGLRHGIDIGEFIMQLRGLSCPHPQWDNGVIRKSCIDALSTAMADIIKLQGGKDVTGKDTEERPVDSIEND